MYVQTTLNFQKPVCKKKIHRNIPISCGKPEKEGCKPQTEECDSTKKVCFTAKCRTTKTVCSPQPPKKECGYTTTSDCNHDHKDYQGEQGEGNRCFEIVNWTCMDIPQPDKCIEVEVPPVVECQPVLCPPSTSDLPSENCIVSNITNISQQIVEKCELVKENVCENQQTLSCEDVPQTTCKECKTFPKVTKKCRTKPTKKCKTVEKIIMIPEIKEHCEEKCFHKTKNVCKKVPFQQCKPVEEEIIKQKPEKVCW